MTSSWSPFIRLTLMNFMLEHLVFVRLHSVYRQDCLYKHENVCVYRLIFRPIKQTILINYVHKLQISLLTLKCQMFLLFLFSFASSLSFNSTMDHLMIYYIYIVTFLLFVPLCDMQLYWFYQCLSGYNKFCKDYIIHP